MNSQPRTVYLLARIYHVIREQMDSELARLGITSVQYSILSLIRAGDGLSSAQLARRYRVKPQSMIKIVKDLEDKDLIERHIGPDSRKALVARLTAEGSTALDRCDATIDRFENRIFTDVAPEDIAAFRRVARTLIDQTGFSPDGDARGGTEA
ncbi:MarR family winged helix-turn-helix transcriptional regulator [Antarcticimicrobium luteum]|uniref:MarR family transcriptional regulator n=1 Tax=Antarcticimicrobium luteum TaxID=2547397 RepID=A0A4R5V1R1_9RHOB|nr:MarR family transcriptional regulator [Antarcticimicrobium luteum]TDK45664.1 MarR family transcriptional regulator [Antarcticimicrobium luteum]